MNVRNKLLFGSCALLLSYAGIILSFAQGEELRQSPEPPTIPVALDAYSQWEKLPYQRIGVRAYMRSTYDRTGYNRSADASHFLYQEAEDFNVTLDVKGPGVLYFKRTNHWHGSPWHYEVDGDDFIVKETSTDNPVGAKERYSEAKFLPSDLFPNPLTWTWTDTHGADLMWVPVPFEDSFRLAYGRTFYGTGYYIYHQYPLGVEHVSQPIHAWNRQEPDPVALGVLIDLEQDKLSGEDQVVELKGDINLGPMETIVMTSVEDAPSVVRSIVLSAPRGYANEFGKARLRVTWDDRWHASIDAPLDLLFGAGQLRKDEKRDVVVNGLPARVWYDDRRVYLRMTYPMPFFSKAKFELQERMGVSIPGISWSIKKEPFEDPINHVGYFHATYTDHPSPVEGEDLVFLNTVGVEGSPLWSGHFVGMSWVFSRDGVLSTLEGDPRFFFDDSKTPQGWGTGTEEWGGGGDYWGGRNMSIPLAGHPMGKMKKDATDEVDLINSAYRFLIADHFPFGRNARIQLEHGGHNESVEHYSGVVYWYGMDSPTLVQTDMLNVCHEESIEEHRYVSETASEPYQLVSRYEWGAEGEFERKDEGGPHVLLKAYPWGDDRSKKMYYPAEEDKVRTMTGGSTFEMNIFPENLGVMLRRKFDYQYPNQQASVWVRDAVSGGEWNYVGEWYTSGSNTCVFSNPNPRVRTGSMEELNPTQVEIVTSNRRWREEEFLIARKFTEGVEKLEIKLKHVPNDKELYPGQSFPEESVWSASRYWIYCYKMPEVGLIGEKREN